MNMKDQSVKKKWLRALRSGKFKQAQGDLYDGRAYCCLGVLAKIKGAELKLGKYGEYEAYVGGKAVSADGENFLRPRFAGLSRATQERLAELNDGKFNGGKRHSFKKIADYIEENL